MSLCKMSQSRFRRAVYLLVAVMAGGAGFARDCRTEAFDFHPSDKVVFIGNTFAERLHLFGYFETFLHSRFPDHQLVIRNLGWSADEITLMPRPRGFGNLHRQLADREADVIFACFGMNESFAGEKGLAAFRRDLDAFIADLLKHQYNGKSAPRIVLVSPIAQERAEAGATNVVDRNRLLQQYTQQMAQSTAAHNIGWIDLLEPTSKRSATAGSPRLTFNGIHLTEYGDWIASRMMAQSLDLLDDDQSAAVVSDLATTETLRRIIYEKNYNFYIRWRGPNGEYLHGSRNQLPGAIGMPDEMAQYDKIIEQYERQIWALAKPRPQDIWRQAPSGQPIWATTPGTTRDKAATPDTDASEEGGTILSPAEALKTFHVAPGYTINLFASEVKFKLENPMALNFDAEGRLWVANSPTWPQPIPGQQPEDSVVILEDTDHDGTADKQTVFIDNLNMIHGFALGSGGVYISQAPNLIHVKDTNGDSKADDYRMLLHGFGTEDIEHAINNYRWGPDGALYFMEGIFFHSQIETSHGPRRLVNAGAFRFDPRSGRLDPFVSYSFWNPWGQVFDRWGQSIILDASSGDYHNMATLSANFVYPKQKRRNDALSFAPELTGPSAGLEIIRNRHFPLEAQGRFLVNELTGFRGTHWNEITESGTAYKLKQIKPPLFSSSDPFFRPIAMAFGPDGALYIVDFYSPIIENTSFAKRHPGRDRNRGRIWRITHKDRPLLKQPTIAGQKVPVLLDLLRAYESTTRHFARRELQQRPSQEVLPQLEQWIAALDPNADDHEQLLVESLWIYQGLGVVKADLLKQMLASKDARAREAATRVLRFWLSDIDGSIDLLAKMVEDENPRVRLMAVIACGFSKSNRAMETALQAAKYPMDEGMKHALDDTMQYFERQSP